MGGPIRAADTVLSARSRIKGSVQAACLKSSPYANPVLLLGTGPRCRPALGTWIGHAELIGWILRGMRGGRRRCPSRPRVSMRHD